MGRVNSQKVEVLRLRPPHQMIVVVTRPLHVLALLAAKPAARLSVFVLEVLLRLTLLPRVSFNWQEAGIDLQRCGQGAVDQQKAEKTDYMPQPSFAFISIMNHHPLNIPGHICWSTDWSTSIRYIHHLTCNLPFICLNHNSYHQI
jgi:hypothetical protein